MVIDMALAYNTITRIPLLRKINAIICTWCLVLKFPTPKEVVIIRET